MARALALLTIVAVAALMAAFVWFKPFGAITADVPPTEDLAFERVWLNDKGIHATLRADGSEPVSIAQVQVDGAYRSFTRDSEGPVSRLGRTTLTIPFAWIAGEPLTVVVVTGTGVTFDHVIDVAVGQDGLTGAGVLSLIAIGLFVGFVPILMGYGFLPILAAWGPAGRDFALGLTLGLLAFLLIDTVEHGLEFAAEASGGLNAAMAFWTAALLTMLALVLIGRRDGIPSGARLAFFIALGIGFHNFGEGIAIGASITVGEVALAAFLVVGFFLHNLSEAIAIAAPYRGRAAGLGTLALLALLAGGPAAIGTVVGAFAFTPFAAALAFAIGAGAIAQVTFEVGSLMLRLRSEDGGTGSRAAGLGIAGGLIAMYGTTLLVAG